MSAPRIARFPALLAALCLAALLPAARVAAQPRVTATGEAQRLQAHSVAPNGAAWTVTLTMDDDNGNRSLPSSYRRWWHCQIGNLRATGERLDVRVTNAGYTDIILPVWSLSTDGGQTFGPWQRVPLSALPTYSGGTHAFTLLPRPGTTDLRLAKFFPYGVSDKDRFLAGLAPRPGGPVRAIQTLGTTAGGRPIHMLEITEPSVTDAGKRRVWIHSGIHPAETTSYFVVEGLVTFLLSGSPYAALLLDRLILDVVPMANPDGVFLGNYRTNSLSSNLEDEWAAPYASPQREIVALRGKIEQLMGTTAARGANPIEVVLNLHSTHGFGYPIHYQHVANASFDLVSNRTGVVPAVHALEGRWITGMRARSRLTALGTTESSTVGAPTRPFVESMMHDRWSIDPAWTGAPNFGAQVMAITYEGTYGRGLDQATWSTPDDWRAVGRDMALAIGDFFGLFPGVTLDPYGAACSGLALSGVLVPPVAPTRLDLSGTGAPVPGLGLLAFGADQIALPLPPAGCPLRTTPLLLSVVPIDGAGRAALSLPLPGDPLIGVRMQLLAARLPGLEWATSNGLRLSIVC